MPLFRTLSDEVISSLCHRVRPLTALKGQEIMREGTVGREMYMVMSGEVEVVRDGERLGFLSEGAFFGELPVLTPPERPTPGSERRTRTVRSVTDNTELCYITKESMDELQIMYPEMRARIRRFIRNGATRGKKLDDSTLRKLNMTRTEMDRLTNTYRAIQDASRRVRADRNWGEENHLPWKVVESKMRADDSEAASSASLTHERRLQRGISVGRLGLQEGTKRVEARGMAEWHPPEGSAFIRTSDDDDDGEVAGGGGGGGAAFSKKRGKRLEAQLAEMNLAIQTILTRMERRDGFDG